MRIQIFPDPDSVARAGAAFIASEARNSIALRGRFLAAISGGRTPWQMLRELTILDLPWSKIYVMQVDERIAPSGHADRNLTNLHQILMRGTTLLPGHLHPMPVNSPELEAAAAEYARMLQQLAGQPPILDLIHLGLGSDGHTASLIPSDPVLKITDRDVALTGEYQGRRRMTLTYPMLNRARRLLWIVTGAGKSGALRRLQAEDTSIPAARVSRDRALVLADGPAASELEMDSSVEVAADDKGRSRLGIPGNARTHRILN
jgi:6-phosphogluconolactonase